jgi:FtsP/CotA-like multicopper oxidase with cupredoxin domain
MFTAASEVDFGAAKSDVNLPVVLSGDMTKYDWLINGEPYSKTVPLQVRQGQRATLAFDNTTMMWHPMHLHGHTFQVIKLDGTPGPRKDTVAVLPKQKLSAVLVADNPGIWVFHLPQHLSPRGRHDDSPRVHHLSRHGGQARGHCWRRRPGGTERAL